LPECAKVRGAMGVYLPMMHVLVQPGDGKLRALCAFLSLEPVLAIA
jgi:hypothetical protein